MAARPLVLLSALFYSLSLSYAQDSSARPLQPANVTAAAKDVQTPPGCQPPGPQSELTTRLNGLLKSGGPSYILSLCPSTTYYIDAPLQFASSNQEISTLGYPRGNERAMLVVNGSTSAGPNGHSTAIDGKCKNCDGVKLRNIQINGSRGGRAQIPGNGANIEMGGSNSGQMIEFVRSFDPRSWSCLHISEGNLDCTGTIIENNDIGPCGSDAFEQWADGISLSCRNSIVRSNSINTATDGAIVLFGSPGSLVENNTIWVETHTLLGGINLVDYAPFNGDYTGTVVQNNHIYGGFASHPANAVQGRGTNDYNAFIKIGIAIGPRIWFGPKFGSDSNSGGAVLNNVLSGGFGYGIAAAMVSNFTIENNVLSGNTSFFGSRGPNCSTVASLPTPAPFIFEQTSVVHSTVQMEFQSVPSASGLTCIVPPTGGMYWPVGYAPRPEEEDAVTHTDNDARDAILPLSFETYQAVGATGGGVMLVLVAWLLCRWAVSRQRRTKEESLFESLHSFERLRLSEM